MNCDYWGDYMWEVVAFVIIIVIGIFYLIGTYFGAGAVILVIGAIVFGFYKFLHFGDTAEEESEYVENALKFIEFTKILTRCGSGVTEALGVRAEIDTSSLLIRY